jgi:hypothetical protein
MLLKNYLKSLVLGVGIAAGAYYYYMSGMKDNMNSNKRVSKSM